MPDRLSQPSNRGSWRSADFATVEEAERTLADAGALLSHIEPRHNEAVPYVHPGYRAVPCRVCGKPTIVGRESADQTCGRLRCQTTAADATRPSTN